MHSVSPDIMDEESMQIDLMIIRASCSNSKAGAYAMLDIACITPYTDVVTITTMLSRPWSSLSLT